MYLVKNEKTKTYKEFKNFDDAYDYCMKCLNKQIQVSLIGLDLDKLKITQLIGF